MLERIDCQELEGNAAGPKYIFVAWPSLLTRGERRTGPVHGRTTSYLHRHFAFRRPGAQGAVRSAS